MTAIFPGTAGRICRLERNDTLAPGTRVPAGLAAIPGDGTAKTFTIPALTPARRFFRVQTTP